MARPKIFHHHATPKDENDAMFNRMSPTQYHHQIKVIFINLIEGLFFENSVTEMFYSVCHYDAWKRKTGTKQFNKQHNVVSTLHYFNVCYPYYVQILRI